MKKLSLLLICCATGCLVLAGRAEDTPNAAPAATLPEVNHLVHLSELPATEDLMASAKANGLEVVRVDRTADRVVVTYRYSSGATGTVGYALLSSASGSGDRVVARVQPRSSTVYTQTETRVIEPRDPEIIYVEREPRTRVIYRERDDFWLPLTVGLGIGYVSGHHWGHHGNHGHWRGHRGHHRSHWNVHGRWHR